MENIEVIDYRNSSIFLNEIADYVDAHHFGLFQFIMTIDKILAKQEYIKGALTIKKNSNVEIICMLTDRGLYLFGEYSCQKEIEILIEKIDFKILYKTGLFGGKKLIDKILSITDLNLRLEKHRLFYSYKDKIKLQNISKGNIALAKRVDMNELSKLAIDFYNEEFQGKGIKTEEQVLEGIIEGIEEKMVFIWLLDNKIISYMQIIDNRNDKHIIGSVFTKKKYRNQGYGKSLVIKAIQQLQTENENREFGFMANHDNIASIKMFSRIGFIKTYETGIFL